jgi:hypothetical protein
VPRIATGERRNRSTIRLPAPGRAGRRGRGRLRRDRDRLAGRGERRDLRVPTRRLEQRHLEVRRRLRHRVEVEVQRRRQPDAGLLAHLGADDPLRALQRGGGVGARRVVAEHRVEHVGVLEVTGDAHVGHGDEPEPRVLDPGVEHLRDDLLDALAELAGAGCVRHQGQPSFS